MIIARIMTSIQSYALDKNIAPKMNPANEVCKAEIIQESGAFTRSSRSDREIRRRAVRSEEKPDMTSPIQSAKPSNPISALTWMTVLWAVHHVL